MSDNALRGQARCRGWTWPAIFWINVPVATIALAHPGGQPQEAPADQDVDEVPRPAGWSTRLPLVASADQLESVLGVVEPLVAAVGPDQWDAPTPCADWDVRALLGHLVGGNQLVAGILTGRTTLAQARSAPAADPLGTDPTGAYRDSAVAVVGAFRAPGVLERPVTVPFGTVPGAVALHLRIVEVLVHGWDLARATGRTVSFPDEVVEQEVAFSREALPRIPPDRSPFAASRSVDGEALPLDRLVALLGREPHPR